MITQIHRVQSAANKGGNGYSPSTERHPEKGRLFSKGPWVTLHIVSTVTYYVLFTGEHKGCPCVCGI